MREPFKDDEFARCREALRRMDDEIRFLRDASLTFGALADRLNEEVQRLRAELRARDEAQAEQLSHVNRNYPGSAHRSE